jgi:hypothetical protein
VTAGGRAPSRVRAAGGPAPELAALRSAMAVRERARMVHRWVADGRSPYFALDESKLASIAAHVAEVTRAAYPDLNIPWHSRWRHFSAGGIDRWRRLAPTIAGERIEQARAAVDLATVSVLLDAGAGDAWRYREPGTGQAFERSEGLAVASLDMFRAGGFSENAGHACRVDAIGLMKIDAGTLARHFQVDSGNPLVGLEQRSALLRRLGAALAGQPGLFGSTPVRPGNLVDYFLRLADNGHIRASTVLATLLESLSSIWPSGLVSHGIAIGDAGRHPAVRTGDHTDGIVPFHKLTQWLTYSLIEPLATAGLAVADLDELTALAEYRNGGLLVDLGAIRSRSPVDRNAPYDVGSEPVVEWRALTVALMDRLLELVRDELALDASFMMPHLLQGGTWRAGREIALALRPPHGPSPIPVATDGTVF